MEEQTIGSPLIILHRLRLLDKFHFTIFRSQFTKSQPTGKASDVVYSVNPPKEQTHDLKGCTEQFSR